MRTYQKRCRKLTRDEVRAIRSIYKTDRYTSILTLAQMFHVSPSTIRNVTQGATYKDIR